MKTPYYRKTGLPGLAGTHDKSSPLQYAFLAAIPKAIAAAAKGAKVVGTAVKGAVKAAGKGIAKGATKAINFAKTKKGKQALMAGAQQVKGSMDKHESEQSVYGNKSGGIGNFASMDFSNRSSAFTKKYKKY